MKSSHAGSVTRLLLVSALLSTSPVVGTGAEAQLASASTNGAWVYDVSRDFSLAANPNGVWSYGWKSNLTGGFALLPHARTISEDNGVPMEYWELADGQLPIVKHNATTNTAISDSGQQVMPPGSVMFTAGFDGTPQNFGVIRFTAPQNGSYLLESAVRCYLDGDRSGDTDYHVAVNGVELFAEFLAPRSATGYTNTLSLAPGDTVDFLVGRGADGVLYGSGLKIQAMLSLITNTPAAVYDVSRDFSLTSNPNGVWAYGWKSSLGGDYVPFLDSHVSVFGNGVPFQVWAHESDLPAVACNTTTNTGINDGGAGVFPPGTLWFVGGWDGWPQNFCVIRFTVPSHQAGVYRLESEVRPQLDGAMSQDGDYHVVVNGVEAYGEFLPPNFVSGYTNLLVLADGDIVDFMAGRGADGRQWGSGLKLRATLSLLASIPLTPPVIVVQPQSQTVVTGTNVVLSLSVNGSAPLTYQWRRNGTNLAGATAASLALTNVHLEDAGDYTVAVTNRAGHAISDPATLTVLVPASIHTQPQGQTAYWGKTASFRVQANGTPPPSYLWYKDGFPIMWATNATLTLTNLELTAGGDYWVETCNSVNCVTSAPARLVVNPAGVSLGLYPGVTVDGVVGKTYGIQYTVNVSQTNSWITLTNFMLTQPVQLWLDTEADTTSGKHPKRFYRVVPVP